MKRFLSILFALFLLSSFAWGLNMASLPGSLGLSPWWKHSGNGTFKAVTVKEDDKSLKCYELTGGEINLAVDPYRFSPFLYSPAGRFGKYSLNAKGQGTLLISINAVTADEAGKTTKKNSASKTIELSSSWQKIELEVQEKNPRTMQHELQVKLVSGEKALLDESVFEYSSEPGTALSIEPKTTLTKPGTPLNVKILLTKDGKPVADAPVNICVFERPGIHLPEAGNAFGGKTINAELKTDKNGSIAYSFTPENSKYGARIAAYSTPSGTEAEAFVCFADDETLKSFEKSASAIKLKKPLSILLIGDSLSDFSRGYNYSDILRACLSEKNPGMVKLKNAGVGGDFITRIWERISAESNKATGSYRRYMYEGLTGGNPDVILIFLGHNDTKCNYSDENRKPLVSPEVQYETYGKFLDYLKGKCPAAKIVLISSVSSYLPIQQKNAEKAKAAGKRATIFGIPEFQEAFNTVSKKLAEERKLGFVDVYTPTKDAVDKENLFLPDGVHLSPKGNQLVAEALIKYFNETLLPEIQK